MFTLTRAAHRGVCNRGDGTWSAWLCLGRHCGRLRQAAARRASIRYGRLPGRAAKVWRRAELGDLSMARHMAVGRPTSGMILAVIRCRAIFRRHWRLIRVSRRFLPV